MTPMLSVIIPVYNGEKYLAEAVQSILNQPCGDWEIIIVDDGSMDSSGAIADALAAEHENIHVFHIPNGGVSRARNVGIEQASGRYIAFLDADDVLCRDVYCADLHETMAGDEFDILSFAYLKGVEDLRWGNIQSAQEGIFRRKDSNYGRQICKHFCSYVYRRSLFSDEIRFPEGIRYHEDVGFLFLIARKACILKQYSSPWFIYRMNFNSVMHKLASADYILEEIQAWNWCKQRSPGEKDRRDCDGNVFSYMAEYIRLSCGYGKPAREIIRTVRENPYFQEAMGNYGSFWMHAETDAFYHAFMDKPGKLWLKYRCIGLTRGLASRLIRTRLGRVVDQKIRYRLRLDEYVSTR